MKVYTGETLASLYDQVREDLLIAPKANPRGMATKEVVGASLVLTNPRSRLMWHEDRKFNLMFAVAEAIQIFSPSNALAPFTPFNKNLAQFSDDGITMYGSYGARISPFIGRIITKLQKDPDSRQAILTIHRVEDSVAKTKDTPCTIAVQFILRNNKLDCFTYMRSNDFYWGLPYDVHTFSVLQEVVANSIGVGLGSYHHTVTSLHVYEKHFDWLEKITNPDPIEYRLGYQAVMMRDLTEFMDGIYQRGIYYPEFAVDSMRPYSDLLVREKEHQSGIQPDQLTPDLFWAYNFVRRWYQGREAEQ